MQIKEVKFNCVIAGGSSRQITISDFDETSLMSACLYVEEDCMKKISSNKIPDGSWKIEVKGMRGIAHVFTHESKECNEPFSDTHSFCKTLGAKTLFSAMTD